MTNPICPITKKNTTELFSSFKGKDIIELYRAQLDIDVSRFFKDHPVFDLYQCNETGYKFYYPQDLSGDGKFYETLQIQLGDEYYHEWKFENQLAFDAIQANDRVLDIGCGIGNFLAKAVEKTSQVYGLELNENAISICISKGLNVYRESIQDHAATHKEYYDVICVFQVLEHIYAVKEFIDSTLKALKKGGKLIIGVPNNQPYFLGYDKYCTLNLPPHHMGLWNEGVFEKFAKLFNLSILEVKYDTKGRILTEAYLRAKYLTGVKSLIGKHSLLEKIKIGFLAFITLPATIIKKMTKRLNGSHMVLMLKKL